MFRREENMTISVAIILRPCVFISQYKSKRTCLTESKVQNPFPTHIHGATSFKFKEANPSICRRGKCQMARCWISNKVSQQILVGYHILVQEIIGVLFHPQPDSMIPAQRNVNKTMGPVNRQNCKCSYRYNIGRR